MPTFSLVIEYDGRGFSGWQRQPEKRTIQGELEKALKIILRSPHQIVGASRTDAGVHARGQVASFFTEVEIAPHRIQDGINAICRPEIAVSRVKTEKDDFNARFKATGKHYLYRVLNRRSPSPHEGFRCWHVTKLLDLDKMNEAARYFTGTHDFKAFRAADCCREDTQRTLKSIQITKNELDIIEIHVYGEAFLKYMVRIIAGTLVDIGREVIPVGIIPELFSSGQRIKAGKTAPPSGLTLVEVFYE